jgi:hypothetical protein
MRRKAMRIFLVCLGLPIGQSPRKNDRRQEFGAKPGRKPGSVATLVSAWITAVIIAQCAALYGQNVVLSGSLSGRLTDQTGAVVPGALVVVRNLANGVERAEVTNRAGLYRLPVLSPGTYSVKSHVTGFRDTQAQVEVLVGSTTSQDFRLQVGNANLDTVMVTGHGPLLRPTESSANTVLDHSLIEELPINGRKYTNFSVLTPNTAYDGDTGLVSIAGQPGGEDSGYANGNGSSKFTVDGTNATSNYFSDIIGRYRIPYLYGEDSIQEFQVSVSPYSAVYGGGAGFVNSVTRSGGNAFHGSAFYFNRNSATGANDALDKGAGIPKPEDSLHQFGAGVGGPIRRDRLWFFFDYEQQRRNDPISVINPGLSTNSATLPGFLNANFGIPLGTTLPAPNGPLPLPGADNDQSVLANPVDPTYLQQVSNVINALNANLGTKPRQRNDLVFTPRLDYQPTSRDSLFLSGNWNLFDSPGGENTDPNVGNYGTTVLANDKVHTVVVNLGWTHTFSSHVLNEFHAGASQDNEIATPSGLSPNEPTVFLNTNNQFTLGNAAFSIGRVFERQYSAAERVDLVMGKHTLQIGFDFSWAKDADTDDGGADPNAAVDFGSPLASYTFNSLEAFALGEYNGGFSQAAGKPTFSFSVPYYGFYAQDSYRALSNLTVELGLREDFQVYPQPAANPAFPLTGQYPNQYLRLAPRVGFAWQPRPTTVVRGGFGEFFTNMNGLNYRNAVVSNGLPSQQAELGINYNSGVQPNQQVPKFPESLPASSPLFQSAPQDISLVAPNFKAPSIVQASLQIQQEIFKDTTLTIGTMWNHGTHIASGSAYDLNLNPLQGKTTYIVCPPDAVTAPCSGPSIVLPNMDSGLLTEGRVNPNLNGINELVSPGQNHYNSLFAQLQRRMTHGLAVEASYTFAKSIMLHGMDFNNQFDFSNTHAPSLLDQRHKLSIAAAYQPHLENLTTLHMGRTVLEDWKLSTIMEFSSGRPFAGLLGPSANGNSLNDTAINEVTANTAAGINGSGPTPGIGLNSFYGPWLERVDVGLARSFSIGEGKALRLQAEAFNVANHANYYVQNGGGIVQTQYNPMGVPGNDNCGDGQTLNQTCYLVPNSGPGNFGTLQEISPAGLPRVLQFSARLSF